MSVIHDVYTRFAIAKEDSAFRLDDALYLYHFLLEKNPKQTLETGCGCGGSTVALLYGTTGQHTAIDHNQSTYYKNAARNMVKDIGMSGRFTLLEEPAHSGLPRILEQQRQFDFILVDADHRFDGIFIEFYYANLLLETKGHIMIHDTFLPSIQHMLSWIHNNLKNYTAVSNNDNSVIFQKTDTEAHRSWNHFKEFCLQ